ncbi:DMT family transporter [Polymorphum gilvum]|uniref:Permease, DMT superfamily n=1 Tax=Polymorphum gilvum (strain LMG 25793 / CGMCC 1.9160 / SL003B-26A1) TaxID=991905 RepID=F2J2P0_POLGS|nr:DMT family transporter [Polymorphum gilvum]ADZ72064.1 Permease, DMT superfamily [Polymorphum gilvum SL003B-26A1]
MELWIPITIFAAFCQNVRSALQKHLKGRLGTTGATFVRFGYGFPFAVLYVAVLHHGFGHDLPALNAGFLLAAIAGGLAQIFATFLLVHLFSFRNFAVGTAYSKTEPVQAALFGLVLLGERVTPAAGLAILTGVVGVVIISMARTPLTLQALGTSLAGRPALIGLASAALFGASAACYRAASLALGGPIFVMQAGFSLAFVTLFQTAVMVIWMAAREPDQLRASLVNWRAAVWVGFAGIAGSIGWFTAMTLQQVAYVRALAQIELVFTFAVSLFVFREATSAREVAGCLLIVASIVLLVLGR